MTTHDVKSWPPFFEAIRGGRRAHELRRDDRGYRIGDRLNLHEYDPRDGAYSGRVCFVEITSITSADQPCAVSDVGLAKGFCILSVRPI